MDKTWPTLLITLAVAAIFVGMWLGWRRRGSRDSSLIVPLALDAPGEVIMTTPALIVATTHHDRPLDRIVARGLAFRAAATVTVSRGGVTLEPKGEQPVAIASSRIVGAGAATWTIDRAVERDGLALIVWRAATDGGDDLVVDTCLRLPDPAAQQRLTDSILTLLPGDTGQPADTGSEA